MAADPVVITCTADTWIKVATAKLTGTIYRLSVLPNLYKQTVRVTGNPAPTDDSDAALIFGKGDQESPSYDSAVDIYIKAVGAAGSVRVDL